MTRTEVEIERLVETWCRCYDQENPEDRWAEQEVIADLTLGEASLDECWMITLKLLASAPNDKVLGIIGASPIEDLLARDAEQAEKLIQDEAMSNRKLRKALGHVWQSPSVPADVYERIIALAIPMDTGEAAT